MGASGVPTPPSAYPALKVSDALQSMSGKDDMTRPRHRSPEQDQDIAPPKHEASHNTVHSTREEHSTAEGTHRSVGREGTMKVPAVAAQTALPGFARQNEWIPVRKRC